MEGVSVNRRWMGLGNWTVMSSSCTVMRARECPVQNAEFSPARQIHLSYVTPLCKQAQISLLSIPLSLEEGGILAEVQWEHGKAQPCLLREPPTLDGRWEEEGTHGIPGTSYLSYFNLNGCSGRHLAKQLPEELQFDLGGATDFTLTSIDSLFTPKHLQATASTPNYAAIPPRALTPSLDERVSERRMDWFQGPPINCQGRAHYVLGPARLDSEIIYRYFHFPPICRHLPYVSLSRLSSLSAYFLRIDSSLRAACPRAPTTNEARRRPRLLANTMSLSPLDPHEYTQDNTQQILPGKPSHKTTTTATTTTNAHYSEKETRRRTASKQHQPDHVEAPATKPEPASHAARPSAPHLHCSLLPTSAAPDKFQSEANPLFPPAPTSQPAIPAYIGILFSFTLPSRHIAMHRKLSWLITGFPNCCESRGAPSPDTRAFDALSGLHDLLDLAVVGSRPRDGSRYMPWQSRWRCVPPALCGSPCLPSRRAISADRTTDSSCLLRHTMPWMPLTHGSTVVPPPPTNGSAHSTGQSRRTSLTSSLLIRQPTIDYSAPSLHLDSLRSMTLGLTVHHDIMVQRLLLRFAAPTPMDKYRPTLAQFALCPKWSKPPTRLKFLSISPLFLTQRDAIPSNDAPSLSGLSRIVPVNFLHLHGGCRPIVMSSFRQRNQSKAQEQYG
ncbi:uncharacterized protein CLUP02_13009 [Colletotrichum lupini]|uniref:Uncharacterized protein n=1 Tax=Colletotrichum lupini TaxID=145971 RepID=A0A9Q8WL76_9PEZI|nr:uncharacterized protein CLUP02_13009 [Colletotrichum lupini]UQC87504.1 hypothetical protein CLUP02_13009 [Colletotrichum lupini]